MSKRWKFSILVLAIVVVAVAWIPATQASTYEGTVEITCTGFTAAGTGAHILDRDNTGIGQEALRIVAYDGAGTTLYTLSYSNVLGTFSGGIAGFTLWTTPPTYNPITWELWSLAGNGLEAQLDVRATGECAGLPYLPVAGCDLMMPVPATAVGGAFVADALVYWAPGKLTDPVLTIPAGSTARVIGVDASGDYYKIVWSCDFLWVPVETVGPNYDNVWNGKPLPTDVVE